MTEEDLYMTDSTSQSRHIGPFLIIEEFGRGGMAAVYKALQPSVNRVVALKVLPSTLENDETSVRRFVQEAQTGANLTHQNIIKVWDAHVTSSPYYIAMQFLEGGTLAQKLEKGPLPINEALSIIRAVCAALEYAHSQGVIHRDIKPENILFDGTGVPIVTDFGIARVVEKTRFTAAGSAFGTPDYMSPEQAEGKNVDYRSDIYSAAVLFYEMITGRPPFSNENPLVTMRQITTDEVPSPAEFGAKVPEPVEAVLMKALAKNPDDRFQSAEEMSEALWKAYSSGVVDLPQSRSISSKPTSFVPLSTGESATEKKPKAAKSRTNRSRMLTASLAVVLLLVAVLTYMVAAGMLTENRNVPAVSPAYKPVTAAPAETKPLQEQVKEEQTKQEQVRQEPQKPAGGVKILPGKSSKGINKEKKWHSGTSRKPPGPQKPAPPKHTSQSENNRNNVNRDLPPVTPVNDGLPSIVER